MYLMSEAYACDTGQKIGAALGRCPETCTSLCRRFTACTDHYYSDCKYEELGPSESECATTCEEPCALPGGSFSLPTTCETPAP